MRTAVLAVAAVILVTGCTTMELGRRWTKAETTVAQTTRDDWECRREAAGAPHPRDLFIGGAADAVREVLYQQSIDRTYAGCMSARGYQLARS